MKLFFKKLFLKLQYIKLILLSSQPQVEQTYKQFIYSKEMKVIIHNLGIKQVTRLLSAHLNCKDPIHQVKLLLK